VPRSAFEGYQIKHGMRAGKGAIEKVRISGRGDSISNYRCCSAGRYLWLRSLDILAEMYSSGIVDKGGRISKGILCSRSERLSGICLIDEKEMGGRPAIVVTQEDIRHLQLAKAPFARASRSSWMSTTNLEKEIDSIIIAGAFGSYIDLSSAITIGMLPNLPLSRYRQVEMPQGPAPGWL